MTLQELAEYHEKQAIYFEPFGATNALTKFHQEAANQIRSSHRRLRACLPVIGDSTGAEAMQRGADISPCGLYRYTLWCAWGPGAWVNFCCLNPSKADATVNDPSFVRMMNFARAWGFDGLIVTNLFAYRATQPIDMKAASDPVGQLNDSALLYAHNFSRQTVAAWGAHGTYRGRDTEVRAILTPLHYLRLTKDGHPGHPLYLPASLRPVEWQTPNVTQAYP